ncbi:MAG: histidine kinase [Cyclobacteriaceae bacterium]
MSVLVAKPLSFQPKYIVIAVFGIGLMVFFQSSSLGTDSSLNINILHVILMIIYYAGWIFLIKYVNGAVDQLPDFKEISVRQIATFTLSGIVIVLVHFTLTNALYFPMRSVVLGDWTSPIEELVVIFPKATVSRMIDFAVIASVLKAITLNKVLNEKNLKLLNLESQLNQSQLNALKAQLNPHFLFNSLHAVTTLIGYDDEKARNMTIKISGLLRKMLEDRNKHTHTLQEELDYIKDYLEIEQERFFDRLKVDLQIDDTSLAAEVPNLILQPLVENAFKHGISKLEGSGSIKISSEMIHDNGAVKIVIENTSPGGTTQPSLGVGLENVKERLSQFYGSNSSLETVVSEHVFAIKLIIPQLT